MVSGITYKIIEFEYIAEWCLFCAIYGWGDEHPPKPHFDSLQDQLIQQDCLAQDGEQVSINIYLR